MRGRIGRAVGLAAFLTPAIAHADPISAIVLGVVGVTSTTAGFATILAATTFLLEGAATLTLGLVSSALFGPKAATAGQDRQADVLDLSIGETPRQVVFGRAATGGSLIDCAYYGGKYGTDWNLFAIALADHECDGIEGFYVNDTYVPWPFQQGNYGGPVPGYNGQLEVHFREGSADAPGGPNQYPSYIPAVANGSLKGVCYVMVAYAADAPDAKSPVWSGRPSFLWVIRGARVYDPRLDDTVGGGAGPQRYETPGTWTWSENASLCEYAYQRGIYALAQVDQPGALLVGRGLSDVEAPPARVIAAANLCDELTPDGPRYRVGGVINSTDTFQAVAQMFADATAGVVTQPEGAVFVEPGQAKTPVYTITDDDLLIGQSTKIQGFASDSDRVNTVVARYIEPAQKWAETSAPVSRDLADLITDGGSRELTLSLPLVPYVGQAQRVADIRRRKARLERTGTLVLGPRFADLEEGDWIGWTSQRRFAGATVYFRITAYGLDQAWRNTLALEEIDYAVYGFGGAGAAPTAPIVSPPPGALELDGVAIAATDLQGVPAVAGAAPPIVPAVAASWATPVDPAISTIRLEVRLGAAGAITPTSTTAVGGGEIISSAGVVANRDDVQARLVPLGEPSRPVTPSPWVTLSTGDLVASGVTHVGDQPIADFLASYDAVVAKAEAAAATAESALEATGLGPDQSALDAISKAISVTDAAIVNDFRDRSPATGQVLNLIVDGHTTVLDDHSVYFKALGRATADGKGFILDMDDAQVAPDGTTLTSRVTAISSQTGTDVLSQVAQRYVTQTSNADALAALNSTISVQYKSYVASATQSFISYADATQAISTATTQTKAYTDGAVATATAQLVSQTDLTGAIALARTQVSAETDGKVASATSTLVSQTSQTAALAAYDVTIKAFLNNGIGATVQQTAGALATLQGQPFAFYQVTATAPDGSARIRLTTTSGGTAEIDGAAIYFGPNVEVETGTATQHWFAGGVQNVVGAGFGANGDLLEWFGPSNIATGQMTQDNAYVYRATNGKEGGPGLPVTGGGGGAGVKPIGVSSFTVGTVMSSTITCTSAGYVNMVMVPPGQANKRASGNYTFYINNQSAGGGSFSSLDTEAAANNASFEVIFTGSGESTRIQVPAGSVPLAILSSASDNGFASLDAFQVAAEFFPILN